MTVRDSQIPLEPELSELLFDKVCGTVRLEVFQQRVHTRLRKWVQFCIRQNDGSPGVVIIPEHNDRLLLAQQYRPTIASWAWEFPRGIGESSDPLVDAGRELREETGLAASSMHLLGHLHPDSGLLTSIVAVVLAKIDDPDLKVATDGEISATRWVSESELRQEIRDGGISDGFTLAALALRRG